VNLYFLSAANVKAHIDHRPALAIITELGYPDFTNHSGQVYMQQPYLALHPEQVGWNQPQRISYLHTEAVKIIRAHPALYMRLCLVDLLRTTFYPSIYNLTHPRVQSVPTYAAVIANEGLSAWRMAIARAMVRPWVTAEIAVGGLFLLWLYTLAARGMIRSKLRNAGLWLLMGTLLYFLLVSVVEVMGPLATPRYRLPIMPIVCIFAAAGLIRDKTIVR
jgi:hypothetical protein